MKANFELVKFISFRYSATVYQGELCVLLYHFVFYGSKIVNISETSTTQRYIQISKSTCVRFVLVMSTVMLRQILNSSTFLSDTAQLLLITCT